MVVEKHTYVVFGMSEVRVVVIMASSPLIAAQRLHHPIEDFRPYSDPHHGLPGRYGRKLHYKVLTPEEPIEVPD